MNRYRFLDIFQENPDGSLTPRRVIEVNGVQFGTGVSFGPGVAFGGVNFHQYKYSDISAEERNGVLVIRGFFKP
jgi:hypothetical protein